MDFGRSQWLLLTRKRRPSLRTLELFSFDACLSGSPMHPQRFNALWTGCWVAFKAHLLVLCDVLQRLRSKCYFGRKELQFLGHVITPDGLMIAPDVAQTSEPLVHLTRKGVLWTWTSAQQQAFVSLKTKLTEAPILIRPDYSCPFTVQIDASNIGLGAILSQANSENHYQTIAYASRRLISAE